MTSAHFSLSPPRFCPNCGGHLSERLLETEDRPRLVCDQCQRILYLNPRVVAGVIIESLQADRAFRLRRRVLEQFTWRGIVKTKILPLLEAVISPV